MLMMLLRVSRGLIVAVDVALDELDAVQLPAPFDARALLQHKAAVPYLLARPYSGIIVKLLQCCLAADEPCLSARLVVAVARYRRKIRDAAILDRDGDILCYILRDGPDGLVIAVQDTLVYVLVICKCLFKHPTHTAPMLVPPQALLDIRQDCLDVRDVDIFTALLDELRLLSGCLRTFILNY